MPTFSLRRPKRLLSRLGNLIRFGSDKPVKDRPDFQDGRPPCTALIKQSNTYLPVGTVLVPSASPVCAAPAIFGGPTDYCKATEISHSSEASSILGKVLRQGVVKTKGVQGPTVVAEPRITTLEPEAHVRQSTAGDCLITCEQPGVTLVSVVEQPTIPVDEQPTVIPEVLLRTCKRTSPAAPLSQDQTRTKLKAKDMSRVFTNKKSYSALRDLVKSSAVKRPVGTPSASKTSPGHLQSNGSLFNADTSLLVRSDWHPRSPGYFCSLPPTPAKPLNSLDLAGLPSIRHDRIISQASTLCVMEHDRKPQVVEVTNLSSEDMVSAQQSTSSGDGCERVSTTSDDNDELITIGFHKYLMGNAQDDHEDEVRELEEKYERQMDSLKKELQAAKLKVKMREMSCKKASTSSLRHHERANALKMQLDEITTAHDQLLAQHRDRENTVDFLRADNRSLKEDNALLTSAIAKLINPAKTWIHPNDPPFTIEFEHERLLKNSHRQVLIMEEEKAVLEEELNRVKRENARAAYEHEVERTELVKRALEATKEKAHWVSKKTEWALLVDQLVKRTHRAQRENAAWASKYGKLLESMQERHLTPDDLVREMSKQMQILVDDNASLLIQLQESELLLQAHYTEEQNFEAREARCQAVHGGLHNEIDELKARNLKLDTAAMICECELVKAQEENKQMHRTYNEWKTVVEHVRHQMEAVQRQMVTIITDRSEDPAHLRNFQSILETVLEDEKTAHKATKDALTAIRFQYQQFMTEYQWTLEAYNRNQAVFETYEKRLALMEEGWGKFYELKAQVHGGRPGAAPNPSEASGASSDLEHKVIRLDAERTHLVEQVSTMTGLVDFLNPQKVIDMTKQLNEANAEVARLKRLIGPRND